MILRSRLSTGTVGVVANITPQQKALQERFEALIAAAAPMLDLVLAVGDRISRVAEPTDHDYYPIRSGGRLALPGEEGYDEDTARPVGD